MISIRTSQVPPTTWQSPIKTSQIDSLDEIDLAFGHVSGQASVHDGGNNKLGHILIVYTVIF